MKKRLAICLILLAYVAASCGGLLQADCCHSDSGHSTGDHKENSHPLSKSQTALHLLKHLQEISDDARLSSGKCCCIGSESAEAGQPSHTFSRQSESVPTPGSQNISVTLTILDDPLVESDVRAFMPPGFLHTNATCRSISTTVLLI